MLYDVLTHGTIKHLPWPWSIDHPLGPMNTYEIRMFHSYLKLLAKMCTPKNNRWCSFFRYCTFIVICRLMLGKYHQIPNIFSLVSLSRAPKKFTSETWWVTPRWSSGNSWRIILCLQTGEYPLVMTNIAIENTTFIVDFPLKMVIFHSYVSLPEGKPVFFLFWDSDRYSYVTLSEITHLVWWKNRSWMFILITTVGKWSCNRI